jgi:hypothetical protein
MAWPFLAVHWIQTDRQLAKYILDDQCSRLELLDITDEVPGGIHNKS